MLALGAGLFVAGSGAFAISDEGPIAHVLGVEDHDPTLRSVDETPGVPRGVVRVRADDGHLYTFAAFHTKSGFLPSGRGGPGICFTQVRDDARRVPSIGCTTPAGVAGELRRRGIVGGTSAGAGHSGGLRITKTANGLAPGDAESVTLRRRGGRAHRARLSARFPVSLGAPTRPALMRAFLVAAAFDLDGAEWLGGPIRETLTVVSADGSRRRQTSFDQPFFPMTKQSSPGRRRMRMRLAARPAPWRSVAYVGKRGTLCNAAAPAGERLVKPTLLQCSSPLAVVNSLSRHGAALYLSNPNPRRERGRGSMAVFGFTRADAVTVTIVNQRGLRFAAKVSPLWATAVRRARDLAGIRGGPSSPARAAPPADACAFLHRLDPAAAAPR